MATVTPLTQPEGCKPPEIYNEIQTVINARRKLQTLSVGLNKQRPDAELTFLREISSTTAERKGMTSG
jgi:hypothetical protein